MEEQTEENWAGNFTPKESRFSAKSFTAQKFDLSPMTPSGRESNTSVRSAAARLLRTINLEELASEKTSFAAT